MKTAKYLKSIVDRSDFTDAGRLMILIDTLTCTLGVDSHTVAVGWQ